MPRALALLGVDPAGLRGAVLHGPAGDQRDMLLGLVDEMLDAGRVRRRLPPGTATERLHGGLDLAATLAAGRPVEERGLLATAAGGVLTLPMAERAAGPVVAALLGMLDGEGGTTLLALDESVSGEPPVAAALRERLPFLLELEGQSHEPPDQWPTAGELAAARARLSRVTLGEEAMRSICRTAMALGVGSSRADVFTARAARAHAALEGRTEVTEADVGTACALVLAPRATRLPEPPPEPPAPAQNDQAPDEGGEEQSVGEMADRVLEAATAALSPELLEGLRQQGGGKARGRSVASATTLRGRRIGSRAGDPRTGARLDLIDTLRAAAPWQRLRGARAGRIAVRRQDFRVERCKAKNGSTIIFCVDASGSSAIHRMAEAKGAVELLLAESYVRRDRAALISFRGTRAEILLPPTRSLARAKRALAALPGGGGTPLAAALVAAGQLAVQLAAERDAGSVLVVLLTDARANVALDGTGGRPRAEADAEAAARALRGLGVPSLLIDTAPRPGAFAAAIASAMGGRYLALPTVDARRVKGAIEALREEPGAS
jgi:magnesium chelatase subunit D